MEERGQPPEEEAAREKQHLRHDEGDENEHFGTAARLV
jgi:hypothetical protein